MAEPLKTRKAQFAEWTAEEIQAEYRLGYLTAQERNKLMREKAHWTMDELLGEKGYAGAFIGTTLEHINKGWANLTAAATRVPPDPTDEPGKAAKDLLYYTGLAIWGQIEMLTSAFSAFGQVNGAVAERWALSQGMAPGAARVLSIAVDVGSGAAVPTGFAAKAGVKVVQRVQDMAELGALKGAFKAEMKQAGKAAGKELDAGAGKAAEAESVMGEALTQGLAVEGVVGKSGQAAKAAGVGAGEDVLRQATRRASVQEQFTADLTKFRREMRDLTETQTHKQTEDMAEALGYSLDDLMAWMPGQAKNETEILAGLKALEPHVTKARELATAAVSGTEAQVNAFAKHMSEFLTVAPKFRGAGVTAGRAVEIQKEQPAMKQITDMLMGWDPESLAKGDFQGAARTMAEDLLAMPDRQVMALGVAAQGRYARVQEGAWPVVREFYMNLLLARPVTQVRNLLGNSFAAGNAVLETMTGALFSADRAAGLTGKEGFYMLKGMHAALGDAFAAYGKAFTKLSPEDISKLDYIPGAIPGLAGSIIRTPGNSLIGMDNAFKTILRRASYYGEAMRDGTHMVKAGTLPEAELANFVARRVNFPTQQMLDTAEAFALKNTFQNELGTVATHVRALGQLGPLALWFPFMKTPINLMKYAWDRTPGLQLLSKQLYQDIAAGGATADMAIGRLTLSNLQGMFIFELAKEGMITGSGPVDPALRKEWLLTHEPYSVKTPQGWAPISNVEPANTPLGMMADFTQIIDHLDEPTAEQGAMAVTFSVMRGLVDKSWWRTLGDLTDIGAHVRSGRDLGKRVRDVALGPFMTMSTGGPLVAGVARVLDPQRRETRTLLDSWMSKVPGFSQTVPPMTDGYGDLVLPPQAVGSRWLGLLSPVQLKPPSEDPVKVEGSRLQVPSPEFGWTIGGTVRSDFDIREPFPGDKLGVELSAKDRYQRIQLYKEFLRHPEDGLAALINDPDYQLAPPALQRQMFSQARSQYWKASGERLLELRPDIHKKVLESDAARLKPLLDEQGQQDLQRDLGEAIGDLFTGMPAEQQDNLLRYGVYGEDGE